MGLSFKKGILLAKIEATPGTKETLAVGDGGMIVTEINYTPNISSLKRGAITQDFGQLAAVAGTFAANIDFTSELKGSGAAGTPTKLGTLLQMCGFVQTIDAGVDVQYALGSTGLKKGTIAFDMQDTEGGNGPRFLIFGAMGNLVISGNVGEFGTVRGTMQGVYDDVADVAALSPTFETQVPPVFRNGTFTVGGDALKVRSFSIDIGSRIVMIPDINAANGFAYATYVDREPTISFDVELPKVATHDIGGKIKDNTENALVISTPSVAGNTVRIDASKVQYTGFTLSNDNNVPVASISGQINKGGANELLITES